MSMRRIDLNRKITIPSAKLGNNRCTSRGKEPWYPCPTMPISGYGSTINNLRSRLRCAVLSDSGRSPSRSSVFVRNQEFSTRRCRHRGTLVPRHPPDNSPQTIPQSVPFSESPLPTTRHRGYLRTLRASKTIRAPDTRRTIDRQHPRLSRIHTPTY